MRLLNAFLAGIAIGAIAMKYLSPLNERTVKNSVHRARLWKTFGKKWKRCGSTVPDEFERFC